MSPSRVLFVTAFHPGGKGVIGAGEAISEDSLRALCAAGKHVHVLCLAPDNQVSNPNVVSLCHSYQTLPHSRMTAILGVLHGIFRGSLAAPWLFTRASKRSVEAARRLVRQHGVEEVRLDFPSTLGFAAFFGKLPVEYFVHDVVAQKIERRYFLHVLGSWVRRAESRLLRHVRRCIVMADKDGDILRNMGFSGEIEIQPPAHVRVGDVGESRPISEIVGAFGQGSNLVFFGSMRRPENHWSLIYFIAFRFPALRKACPGVRLWVLGIGPRLSLKLLARWVGGVEVVGAVDDPVPAFRAASLCVVPLRFGAGVKIKVLQMLEAGATVVSTPVGAEGITTEARLVVADDAQLVATVSRLLQARFREQREMNK